MACKWLLLITLCLFVGYSNQANETLEKVGPRVRRQLALAHSPKLSSIVSKVGTALKLARKALKFAGYIGGILEIYSFVTDLLTDSAAVSPELKAEFDKLHTQLSEIQKSIADLTTLVKEEHLRTRFAQAEKVIVHCTQSFNQYLQSNESSNLLQEFLDSAKELEREINYLLSGMAGDLLFSGDLVSEFSSTSRCRSKKLNAIITQVVMLTVDGIVLHAAYRGLKNFSEQDNAPFRTYVNETLHKIRDNLARETTNCRKLDAVENELNLILKDNSHLPMNAVLDSAFTYLTDRFDTRQWFVAAYDRNTKASDDFQSYSGHAKVLFHPDFYRSSWTNTYHGAYSLAALAVSPDESLKLQNRGPASLEAFCKGSPLRNVDYYTNVVYKIHDQLLAHVTGNYRYVIIRPDAGVAFRQSADLGFFLLSPSGNCIGWKDFKIIALPPRKPEDIWSSIVSDQAVASSAEDIKNLTISGSAARHWVFINAYAKALSVMDNYSQGWSWINQRRYNREEGQEWKLSSDGLIINHHNKCLMTKNHNSASQQQCDEIQHRGGLYWTYRGNQLKNVYGCLATDSNNEGSWVRVMKCDSNNPNQLWYLSEDGVSRSDLFPKQEAQKLLTCPNAQQETIKPAEFIMQISGKNQVKIVGFIDDQESRWYYESGRLHNGRCLCLFGAANKSVLTKPCDTWSVSQYWFRKGNQLWNSDSLCLQRDYISATKFRLKVARCNAREVGQKWKNIS